MTTQTLYGFIVRETENAVAFAETVVGEVSPLWVPRKKISIVYENGGYQHPVTLKGETVQRKARSANLEVDSDFIERVTG